MDDQLPPTPEPIQVPKKPVRPAVWIISAVAFIVVVTGAGVAYAHFHPTASLTSSTTPTPMSSDMQMAGMHMNDSPTPTSSASQTTPTTTPTSSATTSPASTTPTLSSATPTVTPTPSPTPTSTPTTHFIAISGFAFSAPSITIHVGDTITWTNQDTTTHTVTSISSGPLNSGNLAQGATYSYTFNSTGTFNYHCAIHTFMTGSVTVE